MKKDAHNQDQNHQITLKVHFMVVLRTTGPDMDNPLQLDGIQAH
jgi:hypothetical protein